MYISVVIPTYNRARILKGCLDALYRQDLSEKDYEVIVVDDGSRDDTKAVLTSFAKKHSNFIGLHQVNQGRGVARNLGIQNAKGQIVVFVGDDIIADDDFLTQHLRFHLRYPYENQAVLGYTTWHPKLTITPYMRWLSGRFSVFEKLDVQRFNYEKLSDNEVVDYNFFNSSNISLKKDLLDKYPFDPVFSRYAWENIELGYRLFKRVGLQIYYNSKATGYHDHAMGEDDISFRMRNIGESAYLFHRKYPELKKLPSLWKQFVFRLLSNSFSISLFRFIRDLSQGRWDAIYFYALSGKYFLEGLHKSS